MYVSICLFYGFIIFKQFLTGNKERKFSSYLVLHSQIIMQIMLQLVTYFKIHAAARKFMRKLFLNFCFIYNIIGNIILNT